MPTVAVDKEDLWERLGYRYSESISVPHSEIFWLVNSDPEEFDRLLFDFGLELDEDVCIYQDHDALGAWFLRHLGYSQTTEEVEENIKKGLPAERPVSVLYARAQEINWLEFIFKQLKIEIPANRWVQLITIQSLNHVPILPDMTFCVSRGSRERYEPTWEKTNHRYISLFILKAEKRTWLPRRLHQRFVLVFINLFASLWLCFRQSKLDLSLLVLSSAVSSSLNDHMILSSTSKTSCIRTSVDVDSLSRSVHTIWTS